MNISYKTNHVATSKSLTEWYFGKSFVEELTVKSKKANKKTGERHFKFWQTGTGYLTIEIN